jgi:hypothetical protein
MQVMKNISVYLILLLVCLNACKTSKPVAKSTQSDNQEGATGPASQEPDFSDPSTFILGYFSMNKLLLPPYSSWYTSGYDDYKYNNDAVDRLKEIGKSDLSVNVIMGTWCSDSRREVPRLLRVLNTCNFPQDKIQLIGVDKEKNSPIANFDSYNIQKVPTIIFYKNNIELGRIIETPATSLEQDMVNILTKKE